ncbi:EFR3 OF PLANT 2 [Hibiscus trionum]|uniref:EFR3 OF PLANT 2 n=1 Tax=Hibiscus trionum TaxID=183268 RepID=A0A9W7HPJ7_HIBTR|nr:EFR3 OF PLANT 2 [Hibiscus trionum]
MSVISGVISRRVLPACGSLCTFCPSLRARSRQPVKRYKRLISEIFPRNKEDGPNDRKIEKLCEYVSKNPLRVPKITDSLEQRFYKELRNENFQSAKIVVRIYKKLLLSCQDQMTLFATSLQSIIQTLLDQTRQHEMQILGCQTLFDFVINQKDSTFMSNLEGFVPKVCQLAQETGEGERETNLRSAGLQAISSLIWLMAEHAHIPVEFDNIVSVVLENYGVPKKNEENLNSGQSRWVQEVQRTESRATPSQNVLIKVPSWRSIVNEKGELNVAAVDAQNPCFWSRVCLHNMAKLAKEATTTRRVHESMFCYFDKEKLWSTQDGLAMPVLREMQILMDGSGQNAHLLLSVLVKHLDHKNVLKQPDVQLQIVEVITSLARDSKVEASVAILSAVSDVMRHLRKSMHCSLDDATIGTEIVNWNKNFKEAVDDCLVQLSHKVGDAGPILDAMAVMLENIPNITVLARTTICVVYRTAQIIASIPNPSYLNKAFPEALFHQLLPAMVHPDHEIRIGAHRIFSVVLVPSSVCPQPSSVPGVTKKASSIPRTLSRTVSVFSSSAALFEKLRKEKSFSRENVSLGNKENVASEEQLENSQNGILIRLKSSYSRAYSSRSPQVSDENPPSNSNTESEANSLRLSSTQISLLLSSIWAQSISPENTPKNYEAIAHTFSLVLLFSRAKNSSKEALVRSFQLALSLRSISLDEGGTLPPSRRRSLFTLATSMILFSSKAFNILPIVDCTKAALTEIMVDPFLHLVDDRKLQAVNTVPDQPTNVYGSKEDDTLALKTLSEIQITPEQSRETLASEIVKSLGDLLEPELSTIQAQLLSEFLPDDVCPLGAQLPMDALHKVYQAGTEENKSMEGVSIFSIDDDDDDDAFLEPFEAQTKDGLEFSGQITRLKGVNQLLESVLETAYQFGRSPMSTGLDLSYKEIAHHCEALVTGKQQKMSPLTSTRPRQESLLSLSVQTPDNMTIQADPVLEQIDSTNAFKQLISTLPMPCATEYHNHPPCFSLPASTPYDNFLKAAGC